MEKVRKWIVIIVLAMITVLSSEFKQSELVDNTTLKLINKYSHQDFMIELSSDSNNGLMLTEYTLSPLFKNKHVHSHLPLTNNNRQFSSTQYTINYHVNDQNEFVFNNITKQEHPILVWMPFMIIGLMLLILNIFK